MKSPISSASLVGTIVFFIILLFIGSITLFKFFIYAILIIIGFFLLNYVMRKLY
ncbi:MAG: hypothetical protein WHS65_05330 [Melioribacteraceae bacterium]